jgi:hypothetical protein
MSIKVNVLGYGHSWDPRSSCGAVHFTQMNPAVRDSASFRRLPRHTQGKPVGRSCPDDTPALATTNVAIAIGAKLSLRELTLNGYQKSSTHEPVRHP